MKDNRSGRKLPYERKGELQEEIWRLMSDKSAQELRYMHLIFDAEYFDEMESRGEEPWEKNLP
jgi:hypothetical protein